MAEEIFGELWAVAEVAGPLDVRILVRGVPTIRATVGLVPQRILTGGVPASAIVIQNLSGKPIELGTDRALIYGQGLRIPARSQWSVFGVTGIATGEWYGDRIPSPLTRSYVGVGVAGGYGTTVRWNFNVTPGEIVRLHSIFLYIRRDSVAAPAGAQIIDLFYQPQGGMDKVRLARLDSYSNVVNDPLRLSLPLDIWLFENETDPFGNELELSTSDASTGGTVTFIAQMYATRFARA